MQIYCYIPTPCLDPNVSVSEQVRIQFERAEVLGLLPAPLPRGLGGQPVRLDGDLLAKVEALSTKHGLAKGRVIGGMLYALQLHASNESVSGETPLAYQELVPITEGLRTGQVRCLMEAAPFFRAGKVIAAECGTGSGKSRIISHAAAFVLALRDHQCPPPAPMDVNNPANPDFPTKPAFIGEYAAIAQAVVRERKGFQDGYVPRAVIVAAPSVENVSHLAREWASVRETLQREGTINTAVVLGRGQFLSPSLLRAQLDECETQYPLIEDWLKAGMPAGQIPATRNLREIEPTLCGLMVDLEALASDSLLDLSNVALDEDSPGDEQTVYKTLRVKAFHVDLVWTTHAMFCLDTLRLSRADAQPLLPAPLAVFIDEAHLLEQSQAMVAAKSMSIIRLLAEMRSPLWAALRRHGAAEDVVSKAKEVTRQLADMPHETPLPVTTSGDPHLIRMWDSALPAVHELRTAIVKLLEGSDKARPADQRAQHGKSLRYVQRCLFALEQLGKDYRGYIEHSPKRQCLSFNVGPSTVDKYLAARWATTPTVMLLSGMLHYIGAAGVNFSAVHRELRVPDSRQASTAPIHPNWVTGTPVLYTPAPSIFHRFMPPTGDEANDLSMSTWMAECAKVVNLAAGDAAGGMLVLLTGYDRLEKLALAIVRDFPELASRLVVQSRLTRLASLVTVFKTRARVGERPIWLATGSAWTGLDLADELVTDVEAYKDLILTDLVMPNLPFGLQRNTTHIAKVASMGFGIEKIATQRTFRNGLGRGVRREGLVSRRYWVLDGRLQHPATFNYTADLRRVLQLYLHRKNFEV